MHRCRPNGYFINSSLGDLRKQHYPILSSLADVGPAAQATLADRTGIDRSDMVSLLDELEQLRFVTRRPDTADRRRNIVELSDSGRSALKKLDLLIHRADNELLAPLTPEERVTLVQLLARIVPKQRSADPSPDGPRVPHF